MSNNPHGPMRDLLIDEMIDEEGRKVMEGMTFDTVTALLACAGEAALGYAMMQTGLLERSFYDDVGLPVPSIRRDPNHVAVVALGDNPLQLVYDEDFGWMWYNAVEGPSDDPA